MDWQVVEWLEVPYVQAFFSIHARPSLCSSCSAYQLLSDIPSHKEVTKSTLTFLPLNPPRDLNYIDDPLNPADEPTPPTPAAPS
jgi:hypothetical protein